MKKFVFLPSEGPFQVLTEVEVTEVSGYFSYFEQGCRPTKQTYDSRDEAIKAELERTEAIIAHLNADIADLAAEMLEEQAYADHLKGLS